TYRPLVKAKKLKMMFNSNVYDLISPDGSYYHCDEYILKYGEYGNEEPLNAVGWCLIDPDLEAFDPMIWSFIGSHCSIAPAAPNWYNSESYKENYVGKSGACATVYPVEPLYRLEDYVVVERCDIAALNGLYVRYQFATPDNCYYVKAFKPNENSNIYLVLVDGVWVFSGTSYGTSPILKQSEGYTDLTSSCAKYVLPSETDATKASNAALVRYGTVGEFAGYYEGTETWDGYKAIIGEDGKYRFSTVLTSLPYAEQGFFPAVNGIYTKDLKAQIEQLYGMGEGGKFYLCSYVNRNYFSYNTIVVSGMPTAPFVGCTYVNKETWETADVPADVAARNPNGTYVLQNLTEQIYNWYWLSENGCVIDHWTMAMGQPAIYPDKDYKNTSKFLYVSTGADYSSPQYPVPDDYTSYQWYYCSGSGSDTVVDGGSVTALEPEPVEQYWEGYKLYQNKYGKWLYDAEVTRLTYRDYMPVSGRVYDAGCSMEITNIDFAEEAIWACPHDMLSHENDEWAITASSEFASQYGGTYYAYLAFDDNNGSYWQSDSATSSWLQWQNKKRAVVIKQISFYLDDQNNLNTVSYLQGSDDGVTWTDIIRGQVGYPNSEKGEGTVEYVDGLTKITRYFKGSAPCYKYWRLGRDTSSNDQMNIRGIEAYSQLPREVPK
ncbi:MAG: discoidin domain-containing protein, partial [Lentisphaeria bacterium]|nr:discoidin domain-containing protein [Lentisphaeria bacterium]